MVPRCGSTRELPLNVPAERLLPLGGVNGRYPPRFSAGEFCMVPRCGSGREPALLPLNEPYPPRFSFCVAELRFPKLPVCRFATPALGRCMVPTAPELRPNPPLERPPAGIAPTRLCCIVCRKLAVCCWNDAGREMLLCDPKKRCEPPFRIVAADAARPLADRLAREGTTGRLPAIMRAPRSCSRDAPTPFTRPAPKCPALTVDMARPICSL